MLYVRPAGDHHYGKWLFTRLSMVMSLIVSFCAVCFPRGDFDENWDRIGSGSEVFPTYSCFIIPNVNALSENTNFFIVN